MVLAIIQMAKALNFKTIAEGVETSDQLLRLRKKGCNVAQGFFISEPLTASDFFEKYIRQND